MYTAVTTEAQAYDRAEQHLGTAKRGFPVPVRLKPDLRIATPSDEDLADPDAQRFVTIEVTYLCEPPAPETGEDIFVRNRTYFAALEAHWRGQGYDVIAKEADEPFLALAVVHPGDRFTVSLEQGDIGNLWFRAASPPVPEEYIDPPEPVLF